MIKIFSQMIQISSWVAQKRLMSSLEPAKNQVPTLIGDYLQKISTFKLIQINYPWFRWYKLM